MTDMELLELKSSDGGTLNPIGLAIPSRKALVGAVRLITCRFVVNLLYARRAPYGNLTYTGLRTSVGK